MALSGSCQQCTLADLLGEQGLHKVSLPNPERTPVLQKLIQTTDSRPRAAQIAQSCGSGQRMESAFADGMAH